MLAQYTADLPDRLALFSAGDSVLFTCSLSVSVETNLKQFELCNKVMILLFFLLFKFYKIVVSGANK